jgi:hypothetical protein
MSKLMGVNKQRLVEVNEQRLVGVNEHSSWKLKRKFLCNAHNSLRSITPCEA